MYLSIKANIGNELRRLYNLYNYTDNDYSAYVKLPEKTGFYLF